MRKVSSPLLAALLAVLLLVGVASAATLTSPTQTSLTISGLSCGTHYDVTANGEPLSGDTLACNDATAPSVSITNPAAGSTQSGTITVSASASDSAPTPPPVYTVSDVKNVQFKLDGANLGAADTTAPYSVSLDTTTLSNGSHSVSAVATDNANNAATSSSISFTVSNTAPKNFGNTSVGTSSFAPGTNTKFAVKTSLSEAGSVSSISWYTRGGTTAQKVRMALYAANGSSPGAFKGVTPEKTILAGQAAGWVVFNFSSPISVTAGTYFLTFWTGPATSPAYFYYVPGASGDLQFRGETYSSTANPSDPFGAATISPGNEKVSIYATYTPSAPPPALHNFGISVGYPTALPYWSGTGLNAYYADIRAQGFTRVRIGTVQAATVGDNFDTHVAAAAANGLSVLLVVEINPSLTASAATSRCDALARFYGSRVAVWEMGNEANLQTWANGAAYAPVAKACADAIRLAYTALGLPIPDISLTGLSPYGDQANTSTKTPWNFLTSVYSYAGGGWFSRLQYHPYGFFRNATGLQAFNNNGGWCVLDGQPNNCANNLRAIMVANGDGLKPLDVGEHGAPTWSDGYDSTWLSTGTYSDMEGMTEQAAADFMALSIDDFKTKTWPGDFYAYSERDRSPAEHPDNREGHYAVMEHYDGSHKIAYNVVTSRIAP